MGKANGRLVNLKGGCLGKGRVWWVVGWGRRAGVKAVTCAATVT